MAFRHASIESFFAKQNLRVLLYNFFAVIRAASLAYAVSKNISAALGALYHARQIEFPVIRTSLVSTSFRDLFLRYCP